MCVLFVSKKLCCLDLLLFLPGPRCKETTVSMGQAKAKPISAESWGASAAFCQEDGFFASTNQSMFYPLRQVLFECGSNIPRIFHIKRCGRPKLDWFSESIKEAMHTLGLEAPSEITQQDLNIVIRAANNRQGPFQRTSAFGLTK